MTKRAAVSPLNRSSNRYHGAIDDPTALRSLAGEMAEAGYRDAVTLALGRAFDLAPVEDERLERAARVQMDQDHEWLARFNVSRTREAPSDPALRALVPAPERNDR